MISACLVTRGDVDLGGIIESIHESGIEDIVIWDNSVREDLAVYGRYAAIAEAKHDLIFFQDDDCILPSESIEWIVWACDSGSSAYGQLVCNMPQEFRHSFYERNALVGFGACFHRSLPLPAFASFFNAHPGKVSGTSDPFFARTCDIVFTALTPHVLVDVPYVNLPWANDSNRMWKQTKHIEERRRMLELTLKVRSV